MCVSARARVCVHACVCLCACVCVRVCVCLHACAFVYGVMWVHIFEFHACMQGYVSCTCMVWLACIMHMHTADNLALPHLQLSLLA